MFHIGCGTLNYQTHLKYEHVSAPVIYEPIVHGIIFCKAEKIKDEILYSKFKSQNRPYRKVFALLICYSRRHYITKMKVF